VAEPNQSGAQRPGLLARILDSDIAYAFFRSKVTVVAAAITLLYVVLAILAPLLSSQNPFDPGSVNVIDSLTPPRWLPNGDARFLLGTDNQGRDVFSAVLYGLRVSLIIGACGVLLAAAIGITLGLIAGYFGGKVDSLIMRVADVQLTFPAILIALLIDGVVQSVYGGHREETAFGVLVISIGLAFWVQYARTVRGSTLIEKNKDYVAAARLIGISPPVIMFRHVLPNVMGPVFVIATINLALAVITEATLSFLGVGLPRTQPSLGTMIGIGNDFLFSGEWWIVTFPGFTLATLVLAVNLLGDWLRDALNPRLR